MGVAGFEGGRSQTPGITGKKNPPLADPRRASRDTLKVLASKGTVSPGWDFQGGFGGSGGSLGAKGNPV